MYGGRLMVSVLADKWTVSISPCVCRSAGWRGEVRAQVLTQKVDKRTRTFRQEMRVKPVFVRMFVCGHARTHTHADGGFESF